MMKPNPTLLLLLAFFILAGCRDKFKYTERFAGSFTIVDSTFSNNGYVSSTAPHDGDVFLGDDDTLVIRRHFQSAWMFAVDEEGNLTNEYDSLDGRFMDDDHFRLVFRSTGSINTINGERVKEE